MTSRVCFFALLTSVALSGRSFGEAPLLDIVQDSLAHFKTLNEVSIRESSSIPSASEITMVTVWQKSGKLWWSESTVAPKTEKEYKVGGFRNEDFACGLRHKEQWSLEGLYPREDLIYDTISHNNHDTYCTMLYVGGERIDSLLESELLQVTKTNDFGDSMTEFWLEPVGDEFEWPYKEHSVLVDKVTNLVQGYRYLSISGVSDQCVVEEWTQFADAAYPSVITTTFGRPDDKTTIVTNISYEPLTEFSHERCTLEYYGLGKPDLKFKRPSSVGWWIASGGFAIVSLIGFIFLWRKRASL